MAIGGDEAQPIIQVGFGAFLQGRFRLYPAFGKSHPLPEDAGEMVLQVVGADGKDGLFDHVLDHVALHLDQLLVGDLRHRGELVRRQAVKLVAGVAFGDLQIGIFRAGEVQGLAGQLFDQVKEVMGLNGKGAVLDHFRGIETPKADLKIGGGNDHPIFIGLQEKISQDGHGAPAVHHSQGPSHSLQQGFPINLQAHRAFLLKDRKINSRNKGPRICS